MLLGQHRGGGQQSPLLAGGDCLEQGPDRHLRFAKADIAADEPVHRRRLLHVPLHLADGLGLVGGGFVGEGIFEFALPGAIGGKGKAGGLVAFGIELDQVHGYPGHSLAGPLLGLGPSAAPHAVQLGRGLAAGPVAPQAAQLVGGHPQQTIGVLHHQVVAGFAAKGEFLQFQEAADAVVAMHHEIAGQHLAGIDAAAGGPPPPPHVAAGAEALLTKKFPIAQQHHLPSRQLQALDGSGAPPLQGHRGVLLDQPLDGREIGGIGHEACDAVVLLEQGNSAAGLG